MPSLILENATNLRTASHGDEIAVLADGRRMKSGLFEPPRHKDTKLSKETI